MTNSIELRAVQKVVDGATVLDIDQLSVGEGQIVAVVGPVGCGKEALLELAIGVAVPTAGSVRVAGVDPKTDRATFSRRVGVLFAPDTVYPRRTVLGNLDFHRRLRGLSRARVDDVLATVGLQDCVNERAEKLSSGLKRRLAFGCAILHGPDILILADPFTRCDEATITLLDRQVGKHRSDGGVALILSDDIAHLRSLCDTIVMLEHGRIREVLTPDASHPNGSSLAMPFKIPVKLEDKVALVNPGDVLCAVAQEGRCYLATVDGLLPTQYTLTELEARLSRSGFFRAHRSYLVNLQHVKEVIPYTRNAFTLVLDDADGTEIPLSKSAAADLRQLLDY